MSNHSELRKAAILLMSLPEDLAVEVMSKLDPKEVEGVSIEIARIGSVSGEEQRSVVEEFASANPASLGTSSGGLDLASSLVQKALGKNASGTLDNVRQSIESLPFGFLHRVDSQHLLTFIADEHPQTIALILSHLPPGYGAEILGGLPIDRQLSVVRRVARMSQTNPEIIQEVEQGLESRMASVMSQSFEKAGGVATVAEVLNITDRSTERAILDHLAQEEPELVEEIRRLMFVFEDITKFVDQDIQTVFKNVESSQWAMALKGATDEVQDKVLSNMSKRAADLLREEMEYMGPVRVSSVEQAQQQIVDIIRRLEDAGEISLNSEAAEEEYIH